MAISYELLLDGIYYPVDTVAADPLIGASIAPSLSFDAHVPLPLTSGDEGAVVEFKDGVQVGGCSILSTSQIRSTLVALDTINYLVSYANPPTDVPPIYGEFDAYTPCFATGTRIETPAGQIEVQDLQPGDAVTLAGGGIAVIRWIGHRRARKTVVIHFRPGSLQVGPHRDLYVSVGHAMLLGGALVPAGLLVNGGTIVHEPRETVTFWHVELEAHGILLAEGAPAESYLDTGNRQQYANCPLTYDSIVSSGDACAEMVLAGRRLEEIRALLRVPEPV